MLSIIIPTRNRPAHIEVLLESIAAAQPTNVEIIIVSSGKAITDLINKHKPDLSIKYRHSEIAGQINQKLQALSMVSNESSWVMFCDDDLIFSKDFFNQLAKVLPSDNNVIGIGVSLPSTEKLGHPYGISSIISKIFCLYNMRAGAILRNGHACSYMKAQNPTKTQWLSGASIWRKDIAMKYSSVYPNSKYAAYEDVIYSFKMSKIGTLIFMPSLRLDFQNVSTNDVEPINAFISAMFWRNYLISTDDYFSRSLFLWSQLGRNIDFLLRSKFRGASFLARTFVRLLISVLKKSDPLELLMKFC